MDYIISKFKLKERSIPTIGDHSEFMDHCETLLNNIMLYHERLNTMITVPKLTQEVINEHDRELNQLVGNTILFFGYLDITEVELMDRAMEYLNHVRLSDSDYYTINNLFTRYSRIANFELINFGLSPNPNYSKSLGSKTVYYGDTYRYFLNSEILDLVIGYQRMKNEIFSGNKDEILNFAFGILTTLHLLLITTNTTINIEWSDI